LPGRSCGPDAEEQGARRHASHLLELAQGDGRREQHALLLRRARGLLVTLLLLERLLLELLLLRAGWLRLLHHGDHVLLQAAGRLPGRGLGWHAAGGCLLGGRCRCAVELHSARAQRGIRQPRDAAAAPHVGDASVAACSDSPPLEPRRRSSKAGALSKAH
jgi:hypothetical protein